MIDKLRNKLGELYIAEGLTDRVVRLSQHLDKYIVKEQRKNE